jgi:hypothetical protein
MCCCWTAATRRPGWCGAASALHPLRHALRQRQRLAGGALIRAQRTHRGARDAERALGAEAVRIAAFGDLYEAIGDHRAMGCRAEVQRESGEISEI